MFYWHLQNYVDVVNVEIAAVSDHRLIIQNQVVSPDKHRCSPITVVQLTLDPLGHWWL